MRSRTIRGPARRCALPKSNRLVYESERTRKAMAIASGLTVIFALLLFGLQGAKPAHAATTFTVNSTADTADTTPDGTCDTCTLREAIQEANFVSGTDTINFAIPGAGPHTIFPTSELPPITGAVTINGYSESLDEGTTPASVNTATDGTINAVLKIVLSGVLAGPVSGLNVDAPNVVVRGLVVNNWNNYGIDISNAGSGTRIVGNFIGTDAGGTSDQGNRIHGVRLESPSGVTIGGTTLEARNLISGNGDATTAGAGVEISALTGPAADNKVQGNLIGTDKNGTGDLGNTSWGVVVFGPNNSVGGTDSGAANTIAFNDWDGVVVLFNPFTGNRILSNSIFSNGELGIDLNGDGVTANDRTDPDTGPNRLQNFPRLTSATTASGTTTIKGTLNSRPRKTFTIQFFSNSAADPSGNGEGETFLGQKSVKTNDKGNRSFTFPAVLPPGEGMVTATATNNATGDTSEFSGAVTAS